MQKFGFVFPGQGSQKLGMLATLAERSPVIKATFAEASEVLGQDLWEIAQLDGKNTLDQTDITQPALLAASVAIWRLWESLSQLRPSILIGHSLGEYSALVCASAINFQDAVNIVHLRGQFMQSAAPAGKGKMAAIVGLETLKLHQICAEAQEIGIVSAANFNSPGQTVIAGETAAVERAIELCKEAGAKRALPLNVSVPSHCALMRPAAERLERELKDIRIQTPAIAVVQNVNAEIIEQPQQIKQNLVKQLYEPVLWVESVQLMYKNGVNKVIECGPGKVLSGLIRRIESEIQCFGSDDVTNFDSAMLEISV